jgi:hypothetical protein
MYVANKIKRHEEQEDLQKNLLYILKESFSCSSYCRGLHMVRRQTQIFGQVKAVFSRKTKVRAI